MNHTNHPIQNIHYTIVIMLIVYAGKSRCQLDLPNFSSLMLYHNNKQKANVWPELQNNTFSVVLYIG